MNNLEDIRKEINVIDAELAELFSRRMVLVKEVLAYKKKNHLPVLDPIREAEIITKQVSVFPKKEFKSYYRQFIDSMLSISRQYQEDHYE